MVTIIKSKSFFAQATFGLLKWYSDIKIDTKEFYEILALQQQKIKEKYNILLSTKVIPCDIVFLWQEEPSITLEWIQYPKFPQDEDLLQQAILELVKGIMHDAEQNRVVVVLEDETIMLEKDEEIDHRIKI